MSKRLLLVEDDEVFSRVIARAMSSRGYEVTHASCAKDAAQTLNESSFEFAVLDLNLGDHTSLSLIPPLRAANPTMRILMLTGYASIATAVEAIKLGADDYLAKPADTADNPSAGPKRECKFHHQFCLNRRNARSLEQSLNHSNQYTPYSWNIC